MIYARIEGDRLFSLLFILIGLYAAYETLVDYRADGTIDDPNKLVYSFLSGFIAGVLWRKSED
jgi:hypothetical protein